MQVAVPGASSLPLSAAVRRRLGGRLFAAAVEDVGLAEDAAGVAGDRAHVLGLEAERGVADAGRQGRVDGAAEGRVEQGRGVAAVDDADRVVVLLPRFALEDDPALLQLDRAQPHRHRDRRRRHLAGDDRASCTPCPVIVAPAAAVATGSCQTRVRLREVSGLEAAKASATSAAVPSAATTTPSSLTGRRPAGGDRRRPARRRRVVQVGGDLGLADRDPRGLGAAGGAYVWWISLIWSPPFGCGSLVSSSN